MKKKEKKEENLKIISPFEEVLKESVKGNPKPKTKKNVGK